jgi:phenylacetate-coenzyme A ligase PaaK-like adenylate-forming protein
MLSLSERSALLSHATRPQGPGFYRSLYRMNPKEPARTLRTEDEWRALPILTKDDLAARPLSERSFVPLSELDHIRASSGTSGTVPLFSPRSHVGGMEYRLRFHDFRKPFLAFTVPLMPHWHERFQEEHGRCPVVIAHDPREPRASARLARLTGADAFSVFVYHVRELGSAMKEEGVSADIRYIEVTGEVCSRAHLAFIKETFPNAVVVQSYNSSEVEDAHMGIPCRPLTEDEPVAHYHPKKTHFLEILDSEDGNILEPRKGVEGDLIVTDFPGGNASFPLIRFRIGDTVRILEDACPEHGAWTFTVLGRTDMDFVKIPGGVIRADEIARVLHMFPEEVSDRFELHCAEVARGGVPLFTPTLHVEPKSASVNLSALASKIAEKIRVSPSMTYAQGAMEGRYAPLQVAPLSAPPGGKAKRIVWE